MDGCSRIAVLKSTVLYMQEHSSHFEPSSTVNVSEMLFSLTGISDDTFTKQILHITMKPSSLCGVNLITYNQTSMPRQAHIET